MNIDTLNRFNPFNDSFQFVYTLSGTLAGGENPTNIYAEYCNDSNDSILMSKTLLTDTAINSGVDWEGTITVGLYNAEGYFNIYMDSNEAPDAVSNNCSVAFIGVVFGQSNAYLFCTQTGSGLTANAYTYYTTDGSAIGGVPNSGLRAFCNILNDTLECPIVILNRGYSGAGLVSNYFNGVWKKGAADSHYPDLVTACNNLGGVFNSFFWHQGETDAAFSITLTYYLIEERLLRDNLRSDFGYAGTGDNTPWVTARIGTYFSGSSTGVQNVIQAKGTICDDDTACYGIVCTDMDEEDDTDPHYDTDDYVRMGKRWAQCILHHYEEVTWHRGPQGVGWEQKTPTTTEVYLELNNEATTITPASNIDVFELELDSVWTAVTGSRGDIWNGGVTINITHSSGTITGARCLWDSADPDRDYLIRDDTSLTLPIEPYWDIAEGVADFVISTGGIGKIINCTMINTKIGI